MVHNFKALKVEHVNKKKITNTLLSYCHERIFRFSLLDIL